MRFWVAWCARRYEKGSGELNERDGNRAIEILAGFDTVLLLEHKEHAAVLLEQMLGWWSASDMDRKHGRRRHDKESLDSKGVKLLADANRLDLALYHVAETLFKLDSLIFAAPHPQTGNTPTEPLTCANPARQIPLK
jgi:hypothetical protein